MDSITDMQDILFVYLSALTWTKARKEENVQITNDRPYKGKNSEKLLGECLEIPAYGVRIYPAYVEQNGMFGKRLQFAWKADVLIDGTYALIVFSELPGVVAREVVNLIFQREMKRVAEHLATATEATITTE